MNVAISDMQAKLYIEWQISKMNFISFSVYVDID